MIESIKKSVLAGNELSKEDIMALAKEPLANLCHAADEIRMAFCGNRFDLCAIVNAKSGRCSEDCKYCAQSAHYEAAGFEEYPLLSKENLLKDAQHHGDKGILRYGVVTSGKRLSKEEITTLCQSYEAMKERTDIFLCGSLGLLEYEDFVKLHQSGMHRYHNNLETSRSFFSNICTTHDYDEKIHTIGQAQKAGLAICSGGIFGLGETMEDRIDMALTLRDLGVLSVPINLLNPIKGTPLENQPPLTYDEVLGTIGLYRFLLPKATLRLAGGRGLLKDKGKAAFQSGANGAITGDMLTTAGITMDDDFAMLKELGFEVYADV